jgi:nitrogen fixation NifU-like protein
MIQAIKGKTVEEAKALFQAFHALITEKQTGERAQALLGKLMILAGVAEYPSRVKCATLGWQTLMAVLEGKKEAISTETP